MLPDPGEAPPRTREHDEASGDLPEEFVDLVTAPGTTRRWARRVGGVNRVELDDLTLFRGLSPERRLLMMALLLALKDRASALDFEPGPFDDRQCEPLEGHASVGEVGLKMSYVVDGERIELVPPPPYFKDLLIREIRHLAALSGWRRRVGNVFRRVADAIDGQATMPHQGHARLSCGGFAVDVEVLEYITEHGARLILNLAPQPALLAGRAQEVMKALFEIREAR